MKKTLKKTTAATLAVLTILFTFCLTAFAYEKTGGAYVTQNGETTHYDSIAEAWSTAIKSEEAVTVTLCEDWLADEKGSLGEGEGFSKGGIYINSKADDLTLDLNGYKIDRGLKEPTKQGFIFCIKNSSNVTITNLSGRITSAITGANCIDSAGAFSIIGSKVKVSNITITNNTSDYKGGAFFIMNAPSGSGKTEADVTVRNCAITLNKAKTGGAAFVDGGSTLRIYDSMITNNSAVCDGGIHAEVSVFEVSRIILGGTMIIAENNAEKDGTGLTLDESFLTKAYVEYDKKYPLSENSKIVILSKTDDKTLRITANSDKSYIDCYEYENDSYKIIKKGSGSKQYLDIKKN